MDQQGNAKVRRAIQHGRIRVVMNPRYPMLDLSERRERWSHGAKPGGMESERTCAWVSCLFGREGKENGDK